MHAIESAVLWVWDFVVGDVVLVAGVAVAIVVALLLHATKSSTLEGLAGILFFVIVAVCLAISLRRGAEDARPASVRDEAGLDI